MPPHAVVARSPDLATFGDLTPLWRGLRTSPRSAAEGLRFCTDWETSGPSQ